MSSDHRDDVDRLFDCFKCGSTPPLSAMKERKKIRRDKRMDVGSKGEASVPADFSSASSTKQPKHNAADAQLGMEKFVERLGREQEQL